jgi:hypothetical protein
MLMCDCVFVSGVVEDCCRLLCVRVVLLCFALHLVLLWWHLTVVIVVVFA